MALSAPNLLVHEAAWTSNTFGYTTGAFTPPDNSLLVVKVLIGPLNLNDGSARSAISDSAGLTWVEQINGATAYSNYSNNSYAVFVAKVTTGVSMTVSVTNPGLAFNDQFNIVQVFSFTGHDPYTPVRQIKVAALADTADGAQSLTLDSAPLTGSYVVGARTATVTAAASADPGSGFTELSDDCTSGGGALMETQYRTGSTSTSVPWADVTVGAGAQWGTTGTIFALEIQEDTGYRPPLTSVVETTAAYSAANGSSVTPSYPAGISAGDVLVLIVGQKPSTANSGSVTTPTGWMLQNSLTGAGGYSTTLGADTGNTNLFVYTKDVVAGTESGTLSVTVGTNSVSWATIVLIKKGAAGTTSYGTGKGSDTSAGNVSVTLDADPGITTDDLMLWAMCIPTDVTTPGQFSAHAISATGVTFGAITELEEPDSGNGNDIGGFIAYAFATGGPSSAAPTITATAGGTTTNVRGPMIGLRIRNTVAAAAASFPIFRRPLRSFRQRF